MSSHALSGWGRLAAFALLFQAQLAWAGDDAASLSADAAVALALAAHPEVRQADASLQIAKADRSGAALFLGNPSVSAWATPDLERSSLTATQPISLTGEGWHARSAARHAVGAAEESLARTRRRVAAETRRAWLEVSVATGRVQVAEEGAELAKRLLYGVSRKTEEGEASQLELRLARLSQVQAAVRVMEAQRDQASALVVLTGWTLSPTDALSVTADPLGAAPPASANLPDERADVSAARRALAAAEADLSRERAASLPPLSVGVGVTVEDGATYIGPSVGIRVPLFDRNQSGRAAARGQTAVAESQLDALIALAATEKRTAEARVSEADSLTEVLGDDLQVDARAALASVEAGVLAGEIDLATAVLLQAQILAGETAIVNLRGLVASARIDLLLATDDDALLGGAE
ncbi:MAG: outer membrane protein TolC [Myxococcota bacterium]|jgi:outer membrane protein TolC